MSECRECMQWHHHFLAGNCTWNAGAQVVFAGKIGQAAGVSVHFCWKLHLFAVSKTLPSQTNASEWTKQCFSGDSSGLYYQSHALWYYDMYQSAQQQTCAARQRTGQQTPCQDLPARVASVHAGKFEEGHTTSACQGRQKLKP